MTYTEKLIEAKAGYPFDNWQENKVEYGMVQYTPENCDRAQAVLDRLIESLIQLGPDTPEPQKVEFFQLAVEALNDLNDEIAGLIETGEREDLCSLFDQIAGAAGIDTNKYGGGDGIASEWREW
ncbi:MAG TPA: hypothetical protein VL547_07555 [Dinghuibacter sp.]|uniref:hypothetical protein n=1 Tax=Dinghuibacter sp. TaxID=2024697 RepID=UPI002B7B6063|nr:hypothetical protein [Dinghuibacter sp.]HTJ11863.1 hypothetical protein [Dinghuibacter sp.]